MKQMEGRKGVGTKPAAKEGAGTSLGERNIRRTLRGECSVANGTCRKFCGERYVPIVLWQTVRAECYVANGT